MVKSIITTDSQLTALQWILSNPPKRMSAETRWAWLQLAQVVQNGGRDPHHCLESSEVREAMEAEKDGMTVEHQPSGPSWTCCLCDATCDGYGNNPSPAVEDEDAQCCDRCNQRWVIPLRLSKAKAESPGVAKRLEELKREMEGPTGAEGSALTLPASTGPREYTSAPDTGGATLEPPSLYP